MGDERRSGTIEERDEIARRGWDRFVEGVREALPQPHAPLAARDELARFDRLTIAERIEELDLDEEERDVLAAEVESVAHGPLTEAGAPCRSCAGTPCRATASSSPSSRAGA